MAQVFLFSYNWLQMKLALGLVEKILNSWKINLSDINKWNFPVTAKYTKLTFLKLVETK